MPDESKAAKPEEPRAEFIKILNKAKDTADPDRQALVLLDAWDYWTGKILAPMVEAVEAARGVDPPQGMPWPEKTDWDQAVLILRVLSKAAVRHHIDPYAIEGAISLIVGVENGSWAVPSLTPPERILKAYQFTGPMFDARFRATLAELRHALHGAVAENHAEKTGEKVVSEGKLSPSEIAQRYSLPVGSVRKALERWRKKNAGGDGFVENPDARKNEARFLYDLRIVGYVIDALKQRFERR